jgi:hypothetical protein
MASSWALLQAKQDANANPLVSAVAEELASGDGRSLVRDRLQAMMTDAQAGDLKRKTVDELRAVSSILDAKAAEEAQPSRRGCATSLSRQPKCKPWAAIVGLVLEFGSADPAHAEWVIPRTCGRKIPRAGVRAFRQGGPVRGRGGPGRGFGHNM